jgi:NAD(P)-dependent dehydrogenase (short-subunit alcohol dehydrogenase family)
MSQVWFVTGSSRGLGRAIAEAALADGDQVVATARRTAHLDGLVERYGENVQPIALDVTDPEQVLRVVQQGLDAFGHYDVVVNNAGYADVAAIEDVTLENFRAQIDTNFFGVVHVTKAVLPALRERGSGHIFQVSSLGGRFASPGLGAYQSAKWAIGGFSTGLAQEVAPLGIRVTVLEPGGMRTDWAGSSMTIPEVSEPYQQTVGQVATMIRSASGQEPTEPPQVARIVRDLAGRDDAPVRLLIGADAYQYGQEAAKALAESDEKWREVTESASQT